MPFSLFATNNSFYKPSLFIEASVLTALNYLTSNKSYFFHVEVLVSSKKVVIFSKRWLPCRKAILPSHLSLGLLLLST